MPSQVKVYKMKFRFLSACIILPWLTFNANASTISFAPQLVSLYNLDGNYPNTNFTSQVFAGPGELTNVELNFRGTLLVHTNGYFGYHPDNKFLIKNTAYLSLNGGADFYQSPGKSIPSIVNAVAFGNKQVDIYGSSVGGYPYNQATTQYDLLNNIDTISFSFAVPTTLLNDYSNPSLAGQRFGDETGLSGLLNIESLVEGGAGSGASEAVNFNGYVYQTDTYTPVPEPSSLPVLATGLILIGLASRKKRTRA